jgi:hypothetical protein
MVVERMFDGCQPPSDLTKDLVAHVGDHLPSGTAASCDVWIDGTYVLFQKSHWVSGAGHGNCLHIQPNMQ